MGSMRDGLADYGIRNRYAGARVGAPDGPRWTLLFLPLPSLMPKLW
jgi:hypothetical protein